MAALATSALVAGGAAAASGAVSVIGPGLALKKEYVDAAERALNQVKSRDIMRTDWLHVRGGIKKNEEPYSAWQPVRFEG